jgi:hypothetical protein
MRSADMERIIHKFKFKVQGSRFKVQSPLRRNTLTPCVRVVSAAIEPRGRERERWPEPRAHLTSSNEPAQHPAWNTRLPPQLSRVPTCSLYPHPHDACHRSALSAVLCRHVGRPTPGVALNRAMRNARVHAREASSSPHPTPSHSSSVHTVVQWVTWPCTFIVA